MSDVPKWAGPRACPKSTAIALQALRDGRATPDQQQTALHHITHAMCGVLSGSFVPGDATGTAWQEGRRSVGLELLVILETPLDTLMKKG